MDEIEERLAAQDWLLAWLVANVATPLQIESALDQQLPDLQLRLDPKDSGHIPHVERVFREAERLQREAQRRQLRGPPQTK